MGGGVIEAVHGDLEGLGQATGGSRALEGQEGA